MGERETGIEEIYAGDADGQTDAAAAVGKIGPTVTTAAPNGEKAA